MFAASATLGLSRIPNEPAVAQTGPAFTLPMGWEGGIPGDGTIIIPAGIDHDFANRTGERVGLINVFVPGGFETNMPEIVAWFAAQESGKP